jgi:hypothetical protein
VLEPVVARYRGIVKRLYFRGDATFANPEIHEFLEADDLDQLLHALGLAFSSLLNEDKIPIEAPKTA